MRPRAALKRLRNVWGRHGWRMFGPLIVHNLRHYTRHWMRHRSFAVPPSSVDRIPGVETQRDVSLGALGYSGPVGADAEPYQAIEEDQFRSVMAALPIRPADHAFVDLGSGKGRALLLAAQLGFKSITGVEYSADLHRAAQRNMAAARGEWPNVERIALVCGDASQHPPPAEPVVCYLYNPFGAGVMRQVIDTWARAMASHGHDVWVVYSNPTQLNLFMGEPAFEHQFTTAGTAVFRRRR
jgi:predicted RNA methylase